MQAQSLPTPRDLDRLSALLHQQGQWLRGRQPGRAMADRSAMARCFDTAAEQASQALRAALTAWWPDIPFARTESDPRRPPGSRHGIFWLCDPIDGAVQYLCGLPMWTCALTLVVDGAPRVAIIADPTGGHLYRAFAGHGAECGGERLTCGTGRDPSLATLGTSFPNHPKRPQTDTDRFLSHLGRVIPHVFAQRWIGSATLSLALVARGVLDGYWEVGGDESDWLPGSLIAREAGALVTPLTAGTGILAADPALHAQLAHTLRGSEPENPRSA
ncbi:hypothetical protein GCM10011289_13500 [Paludibacterium paludis]|uniref:Myo-inositol-1(Or 4)-monophosphatase n=2 Tax=Paludibacterium paludis TaxID=1225769 RepID=A0A918U8J7_9NEIS|nr:hypothetical protein GCM10011289_13500 [Paludibacterium paludis]